MNILIEEVGLSDGQVKRINLKRQFFPAVERLIDKAVGRIDDEIDPYEPLTKVDILDELVPYLGGLNRQLSGFNESKITRKQLRRLIEASLEISDAEVDAAKKKLEDEGGAAGADLVAQSMRDAEEGDTDVEDDDKYIEKLSEKDPSIKVHDNGDVIDTSGLEESLTLKTIRNLIREELEKLPSYAYYDYGIDQVPNKTDAHEDIIGHT